jgi:protein phosphatase
MISQGITHVGKHRISNQDSYLVKDTSVGSLPNLYIVADGMGGHKGGEVASKTAIEYFCFYIQKNINPTVENSPLQLMSQATRYANSQVYKDSRTNENHFGMGTTFTALTLTKHHGYITHIGDSRVYKISNNQLELITKDHTYIAEMVSLGTISPEEAKKHPSRNMLTRALGTDNDIIVDTIVFETKPGDKLLICSDGLTNMVSDTEIKDIITKNNNLLDANNTLVILANIHGGIDNITSILIEVKTEGDNNAT